MITCNNSKYFAQKKFNNLFDIAEPDRVYCSFCNKFTAAIVVTFERCFIVNIYQSWDIMHF